MFRLPLCTRLGPCPQLQVAAVLRRKVLHRLPRYASDKLWRGHQAVDVAELGERLSQRAGAPVRAVFAHVCFPHSLRQLGDSAVPNAAVEVCVQLRLGQARAEGKPGCDCVLTKGQAAGRGGQQRRLTRLRRRLALHSGQSPRRECTRQRLAYPTCTESSARLRWLWAACWRACRSRRRRCRCTRCAAWPPWWTPTGRTWRAPCPAWRRWPRTTPSPSTSWRRCWLRRCSSTWGSQGTR